MCLGNLLISRNVFGIQQYTEFKNYFFFQNKYFKLNLQVSRILLTYQNLISFKK